MTIDLGPIISFRGVFEGSARYRVLYVIRGAGVVPKLNFGGSELDGVILHTQGVVNFYCFILNIPLGPDESTVKYGLVGGQEFEFAVPPLDQLPRVAFCSCNGFSSAKEINKVRHKNNLWRNSEPTIFSHKGVIDVHSEKRFHLLLMGGDQIYADSIWDEIPEFKAWKDLSFEDRITFQVSTDLEMKIDNFYLSLYLERWSQPELKEIFSSTPTMMMWDDHDIFDGWGSHPKRLQESPLFRSAYYFAKKYFGLFQQQVKPGVLAENSISSHDFSFFAKFNGLAILGLDQRSNRSIDQVIHRRTYDMIKTHLAAIPVRDASHLFVMSSIPIAHPDMSWLDGFASALLPEQHEDKFELMDDLRDHWNSSEHRGERLRLVHNLFRYSAEKKMRVTILSGDVHVAALGVIKNSRVASGTNADRINQITSSGIVHPGPPRMMGFVYDMLSKGSQELDREILAQMLPIPGSSTKFILQRNWVSIIPGSEGKYWFNYHVEGVRSVFEKAVHPVGSTVQGD